MEVSIRKSTVNDLAAVLELIKELALYEKAPDEVTNTVADMEADGFGSEPVFFCDVAESENKIIGIAVYYIKYSTWKGRGIYLDDIIITEKWRRKGIGKKLFDHVISNARKMNAHYLQWQVLDWNVDAIEFYKKYDSGFDDEWINCRIDLK